MKAGGWSNLKELGEEELALWQRVTSEVQTALAAKGPPTKVESQVVAGMKLLGCAARALSA